MKRFEGRLGRPPRDGIRLGSLLRLTRRSRRQYRCRSVIRRRAGWSIRRLDHRPLRRRLVGRGPGGCLRQSAVLGSGRREEHCPLDFLARRERPPRLEEGPQRVTEGPDGTAKNLVRGKYASSDRRPIPDAAGPAGIRGALDETRLERRAALGPLMGRPDDRPEQCVNGADKQERQALP